MSDTPSQVAALPRREFRVGRVLSRALEVLFHDFAKFVVIALMAVVPSALLALNGGVVTYFGVPTQTFAGVGVILGLIVGFGSIFLYAISQAVTLYGAFQDMRGRPFQLGEAFSHGFARFFPLLGLTIAWGFAVVFGIILLIVPGLMLLAAFYVSLPACVVESLGPLQSMSRSAALTKGHRWKVFGIYLLVLIGSFVLGSLIRVVFVRLTSPLGAALAGLVWNALFGAYHSVMVAVMYHDLRVLKDGVDIDRIAAVFD
jgi:hypothetical protein